MGARRGSEPGACRKSFQ